MSTTFRFPLLAAAVAACFAVATPPARAAESYDACTRTLTSLPTVITTQGTWCLKADLATSLASGDAILVSTNNVTIDCNGFKLGGLGGGEATAVVGIRAVNRANLIVRNCNLRGFSVGAEITGPGVLVENNRFESSRLYGIDVNSAAGIVRGNIVQATGLATTYLPVAIRVLGSTDVLDNTVDGVVGEQYFIGIQVGGESTVAGNRVRGLRPGATANYADGIVEWAGGSNRIVIRDNDISFDEVNLNSAGVYCESNALLRILDNTVVGAAFAVEECQSLDVGTLFVAF